MYRLATLVADVAALSAQLSLRNFNENAFYVARDDARVGYWKRYREARSGGGTAISESRCGTIKITQLRNLQPTKALFRA